MCETKDSDSDTNSDVAIDRISNLPDAVIRHILSFVPTVDVVRMSVLSRHWKLMWCTIPSLDFSDSVGFDNLVSFTLFVDNYLKQRSRVMSYVDESNVIRLKLNFSYTRDYARYTAWRCLISPSIQCSIRELDICGRRVPPVPGNFYVSMPPVQLTGKYLSVVKLMGVNLSGACAMNLPCLKYMRLEDVQFACRGTNSVVRNLMSGSPSLERFVLLGQRFYVPILEISSSSLKYLEMKIYCRALYVNALNLQSLVVDCHCYCRRYTKVGFFVCKGVREIPKIGYSSCTAIRDLSLSGLYNYDDQISNLTHLENLTLKMHRGNGLMKIVSQTLKCFSLATLNEGKLEVIAETPNLVSFKYEGNVEFCITMRTPNPRLEGSFSFERPFLEISDEAWYHNLMSFFSNISCPWNSLTLRSNKDSDLFIPKGTRTTWLLPPWPDVRHLKVTIPTTTAMRQSELRKVFKWLAPFLQTLTIEEDQSHVSAAESHVSAAELDLSPFFWDNCSSSESKLDRL